ncbi:MAG: serine/threonine protein kinase [Holophagaceae bacterium]|nr:serine/threonine protein kinase [Holophagaceae bacterium]
MKHPILLLLGCEEFRTPELERALQLKGWGSKWIDSTKASSEYVDIEPTVLLANSGRLDTSVQLIRTFRSKDSFIPLILIGENAFGLPLNVDAFIPRGASQDTWLNVIKPYWPNTSLQTDQIEELNEIFGKYMLLHKIASGGTADIYKAKQLEPEGFLRVLAIKRLLPKHQQDPGFVKMMLDEANLAVQFNHHNIVRILDVGSEAGAYYLAMEYVDGCNLGILINNVANLGITFPEPVAAFLIAQAANALDYVHRRRDASGQILNLVHRDISPQNILVDQEGAVKIIDFGIAKGNTTPQEPGQENKLKGKLLYMSPEQSKGSPTDHRSDTYSLGLVLFEMLAGQPCFRADDEFGLLEKVRAGIVQDIRDVKSGISKPMARILDKALQKNLSNRYRSAMALAQDLVAFQNHYHTSSVESDILTFLKMVQSSQVQTKAFVESHFTSLKGNFVLHSEKERIKTEETPEAIPEKKRKLPIWILPTLNALLLLLAYLAWVAMNV